MSNSTCSWHPAQTDHPPCTSPIVLASCLPRFSLCLGDFTPGLHSLVLGEPACCRRGRERNLATAKGKRPPPACLGAGPGRVQHRRQLLLPRDGWGSARRTAPPAPAPGGLSTADSSAGPARLLARARPLPPLPPRAGPLLPATHALKAISTGFVTTSSFRPERPSTGDPQPSLPRLCWTGAPLNCPTRSGPLNFVRHVAPFKNNSHEVPTCV